MRIFLLVCLLEICFPALASDTGGELGYTYTIPGPHRVDVRKTLKCSAMASVVLREGEAIRDLGKGTLVAGVTEAKHKFELRMARDQLLVGEENQVAEKYAITNEGDAFISAIWADNRGPVVKSILLDKEKGYASWTRTEGTNSETQFLACE
jgi:hypothetical protein